MALGRGPGVAPMPLGPCGYFMGSEGGYSLWGAKRVSWQLAFRGSPSAYWEGRLLRARRT